jgi:hypothetical protein
LLPIIAQAAGKPAAAKKGKPAGRRTTAGKASARPKRRR